MNFTVLYYAATMDAHVGFESWLERDVAMMLDFDSEVVAFSAQPFWLSWSDDGEQRQHAPDFFTRLVDGTGVVIDVRPNDRIKPRDARAFGVTDYVWPDNTQSADSLHRWMCHHHLVKPDPFLFSDHSWPSPPRE